MMGVGYVLSVASVIVVIIGAVSDGFGEKVVEMLDTCVNKDGSVYGDTNPVYVILAKSCQSEKPNHDCACMNYDEEEDGGGCYYYDLGHDKDQCSQVLSYYKVLLLNSANVCTTLIFITVIWSIWICSASCCNQACTSACPAGCCDISTVETGDASEPFINVSQSYQPVPTQQPTYTVQTGGYAPQQGGYTPQQGGYAPQGQGQGQPQVQYVGGYNPAYGQPAPQGNYAPAPYAYAPTAPYTSTPTNPAYVVSEPAK